jgi:hypothetical protein
MKNKIKSISLNINLNKLKNKIHLKNISHTFIIQPSISNRQSQVHYPLKPPEKISYQKSFQFFSQSHAPKVHCAAVPSRKVHFFSIFFCAFSHDVFSTSRVVFLLHSK